MKAEPGPVFKNIFKKTLIKFALNNQDCDCEPLPLLCAEAAFLMNISDIKKHSRLI